MRTRSQVVVQAAVFVLQLHFAPLAAQALPVAVTHSQRDGAHDFDFLIGDWKAHVRRLPDRLIGSAKWIEYDGISRHSWFATCGRTCPRHRHEWSSHFRPTGARPGK